MINKELFAYTNRYIAFLDILGFSENVDRSRSDEGQVRAIANVLESIEEEKIFNDQLLKFKPAAEESEGFYMFSDSIIVTAPFTNAGLTGILLKVSYLLRKLFLNATFIRGAIVQGEVYEKNHVLFGPGLIEAYRLESSAARYPRILVSEDIQSTSTSITYDVRGRKSMPLDVKIRRDFDGLHYLDWMLHYHTVYEPSSKGVRLDGPENYHRFKDAIEFALEGATDDPAIKSKIFWLANYFNSVIERARAVDVLGGSKNVAPIDL